MKKNYENGGKNKQEGKKDHVSNEFDMLSSHISHNNATNFVLFLIG